MRPILSRVTAPAVKPISVAEIKEHATIDDSDRDTVLDLYIDAAIAHVDALGVLGKAMITQTWDQAQARPSGPVRLAIPPAQSLVEVRYYDPADAEQTATLSHFRLIKGGDVAIVEPVPGKSWPTTAARPDAVTIRYVAGYGGAASDVPASVRVALLQLAAMMYDEGKPVVIGAPINALPIGFAELIALERCAWYG